MVFWLPVEDATPTFLAILAGMWAAWVSGWLWVRFFGRWGAIFRGAAAGGTGGALFYPIVLFLAVFKGGLHQHGYLDFSNYALSRVSRLIPFVVLGGVVLGGLVGYFVQKWGKTGISEQNV